MAVKIGFIGCGGIANAHMNSLAQVADARMVGFMDVVADRAKAAADKHGGKAYDDFQKMLDAEQPDACYVCLPPHVHGEQELACVERGIPFLVEKPIARTMETVRAIEAGVSQAGLLTSVGYHWRYYDTTATARRLLADRAVGMVLGYWMGGLPGVHWWRVYNESGGQLHEQTTHIFDLARYLCGEVKRVYAFTALRALQDVEDLDVADVGTVGLEFESGAIGTVSNTCMLPMGYTVGLHVICRDMIIETSGGHLAVRTKDGVRNADSLTNANLEVNRTFIAAVQSKDSSQIRSPYADGVKSTAVSLAALQSAETGEPVTVADL